jgi:hypothetical protein
MVCEMRPTFKPALRQTWRDRHTLQIGTTPERALLLRVDGPAAAFIAALDGRRSVDELVASAERYGLAAADAADLLNVLTASGLLDDAATDTAPVRTLPAVERDRLRPDLAALSLRDGAPGDALRTLARRRAAAVVVYGAGRVGALVAQQLAAAGVGYVVPVDAGRARGCDVAPGGLGVDAIGRRRQDALREAMRRTAPSVRTRQPSGREVDVAVVAQQAGWSSTLPDRLLAAGTPHLLVGMRETGAELGPFVLPGSSSCVRCHHMHRADLDPAWPRILAQLRSNAHGDDLDAPCDSTLAALVAAHAALHVLGFVDGEQPPSVDATISFSLPWGEIGRRSWARHPACGCALDGADSGSECSSGAGSDCRSGCRSGIGSDCGSDFGSGPEPGAGPGG